VNEQTTSIDKPSEVSSSSGHARACFLSAVADIKWHEFLRRPAIKPDVSNWKLTNAGKSILLTGAGGSIGSSLANSILEAEPRRLILLDSSEQNLHEICMKLTSAKRETQIVGVLADVCDATTINEVFREHGVEIVFHAAAFKQVPLLESNPLAAVRNNAVGTYVLAKAALHHEVRQVLSISTDKAADPQSVLGVSKRIAELILLGLNNPRTRMNSIRFGNVLGTNGSVVPRFIDQIAQGGPVTVTHPGARRYFVTLEEARELVMAAASCTKGGNILVPDMGEEIGILELAEFLIRKAEFGAHDEIRIAFIGPRPGDKLNEKIIGSNERREEKIGGCLYRISVPKVAAREVDNFVADLRERIERHDVSGLINSLRRIVPEYQPSEDLRKSQRDGGVASRAAGSRP
jgi:FlaA1/EpsC-like NDP-sugar epimerase